VVFRVNKLQKIKNSTLLLCSTILKF